jgi:hypothetical protein
VTAYKQCDTKTIAMENFMEEFWFAFVVTFVVGIVILILADIYNGY